MTAKVPARIDHHFHYLDVKSVESRGPRSVTFTFHGDKSTYNFRPATAADADVDEMIAVLVSAARRVFPGVPLEHILGRVELSPPERMAAAADSAAWKSPGRNSLKCVRNMCKAIYRQTMNSGRRDD